MCLILMMPVFHSYYNEMKVLQFELPRYLNLQQTGTCIKIAIQILYKRATLIQAWYLSLICICTCSGQVFAIYLQEIWNQTKECCTSVLPLKYQERANL